MGAWRLVGLGVMALCLGACVAERGENSMKAEFARLDAKAQFAVETASPQRTVFQARGRRVVVEPPSGFCLAPDSLNIAGGAAFVLISDCSEAGGAGAPRAFPGIMTVSVSDRSMADSRTQSGKALVDLQAFLTTPEGLALLGRGEGGGTVRIVETRQLGDALYVLVEDRAPGDLPILAPTFWRAFVDVNDRMVLATISGFRDVEIGHDTLLGHLARQVVQLREANLAPLYDEEVQVARRIDSDLKVAAGAITQAPQVVAEIKGEVPVPTPSPVQAPEVGDTDLAEAVVVPGGGAEVDPAPPAARLIAPDLPPAPAPRLTSEAAQVPEPEEIVAGAPAPAQAPAAPRRPG